MSQLTLALYFVIGGLVVALTTYFGSQAKGLIAAFVAFLPSVTLLTISTIYLHGGQQAASSYLRSMIVLTPAWVLYVIATLLLLPRLGLIPALAIGVAVYIGASLLTIKIVS